MLKFVRTFASFNRVRSLAAVDKVTRKINCAQMITRTGTQRLTFHSCYILHSNLKSIPPTRTEQKSIPCNIIKKNYKLIAPDENCEHVRTYHTNDSITIFNFTDGKLELIDSWHRSNKKETTPNEKSTHTRLYSGANDTKLFLTFSDEKMNGQFESEHSNGLPKEIGACVNGVPHGDYKEWNDKGILIMACTFVNGNLEGESKYWNDFGVLHTKCTHSNGILNGDFETWYSTGIQRKACCFANGLVDGRYTIWDPTGKLVIQCYFSNGVLIKECMVWNVSKNEYVIRPASEFDWWFDQNFNIVLQEK